MTHLRWFVIVDLCALAVAAVVVVVAIDCVQSGNVRVPDHEDSSGYLVLEADSGVFAIAPQGPVDVYSVASIQIDTMALVRAECERFQARECCVLRLLALDGTRRLCLTPERVEQLLAEGGNP